MQYLSQIAFLIILGLASYFLAKRISRIKKNILLGKSVDRSDSRPERLKTMLLVAFGQKKMFKKPLPALLHFFIYIGFLVINIEVLEFIIDGIFGTHRIFAPYTGAAYNIALNIFELLAILVVVACIAFLWRRNVSKVKRFSGIEMKNWPTLDANLILVS